MALEEYKKKRTFTKTPEPTGGTVKDNKLHFVVQKHAASHLHYDFRLELKGVLKSWAVPKGPSLDPEEKRLAMITEDHPFDYKGFEGIIPKGQYGGGSVIIWDQGTYETPAVVEALKDIQYDVVVDGELVVLDENGKPNFDLLQKYRQGMPVVYYLFDVLWLNGYDITQLTLTQRKTLLKQILPENEVIKYSDDFEDGEMLFEQIKAMELEGIIAKRKDSKYQPGKRVKDWLKLPTEIRQEFVIGGWTESESGRPFRSIVFGAYDNGKLKFIGHSGSGFQDKVMKEVIDRLKPLEIKKKPFVDEVDHETTPHWVKPELVGNFKFATWTASGKIRKPAIFLGFRDDKDAKDVVREVPISPKDEEKVIKEKPQADVKIEEAEEPAIAEPKVIETAEDSNWPMIENEAITTQDEFNIEGRDVTITNIEKHLWSDVTKSELIIYYHNIASYILPYLKDRPQSLHIKNINAGAPGLYIKDMEGRQPEWADIFTTSRKHKKKGKRNFIDYLVCNNEATLLYMVNLGCIDINPWTSRTSNYHKPDFVIIDLDPSDEDFNKAIETAKAAKQFFDANKLKAFPKTSGKTGIHLYVPCSCFSFPEARKIAEHICREVNLLVPNITTTEVTISKRGNKLYIDPNQNDEADTVAAPYSVRPYHLPSVSTPLEWKEINDKLDPLQFDIKTIFKRLEQKGDLFQKVSDKKIATANSKVLKRFLQ